MHTIFPVIAVTAATFGGIVGWFLRGRFLPTVLICIITPILVQAVIEYLLPHEGYVKDKLLVIYIHVIFPFLLLTVPCLIGGVLMAFVAYQVKRHAKHDAV
jgi:hypothetical protein